MPGEVSASAAGTITVTTSLYARIVRLRRTKAYDLAMRLFGSAWFLLLAAFMAWGTINDATVKGLAHDGWPQLVSRTCLIIFYLALWGFIVTRPRAVAQSEGLMPSLAAFAGTYMPWTITFFGQPAHAAALNLLSAICLVVGTMLMVYTVLHLGRSFSLVPQARRVVRVGPYRWIRHPLYLSEEVAVLGTILQYLSLPAVILLAFHIFIQIQRIFYEEELLRRALPEYRDYEASRWRLIPHVW